MLFDEVKNISVNLAKLSLESISIKEYMKENLRKMNPISISEFFNSKIYNTKG